MMYPGLCLILSAPSGGGKTTLIRALEKRFPKLRHSISYTTRRVRDDGADVNDYHFISEQEFDALVRENEFLEWATVHSHKYGTRRRDLDKLLREGYDVILDIDVQGAAQLRSVFPQGIYIFIMPPSYRVLEERLTSRGSESKSTLQQRLRNARDEMRAYTAYDYVIINDVLDDAVERVRCIITAERCRCERMKQAIEKEFLIQRNGEINGSAKA